MNQGWARACLLGLLLLSTTLSAWSQTAQPEAEYRRMIRVDQAIHPLGAHPFGEKIGLYNGHLSFQVTDVSERGTGPDLKLTRSFELKGPSATSARAEQFFGYWAIDLPRIKTLTPQVAWVSPSGVWKKVSGWVVGSTGSAMRCKNFASPPLLYTDITSNTGAVLWAPEQWWQSYHLIIPGQGSQDLLVNKDTSTSGTYPAVTKNHWRLSCINEQTDANGNPITANGEPGDGFIAHAPDGTKYYFNELIYEPALGASQTTWTSTPTTNGIGRLRAYLLVTKIQDRFGNWLKYNYSSGKLTGITASDGRSLTLRYNSSGNVQSATLQPSSGAPRVWKYGYSSFNSSIYGGSITTLQTVTLPDQSKWQYNFDNFIALPYLVDKQGSCDTVSVPSNVGPLSATVVHPSGLTGTFTVMSMLHGRSFVPKDCADVNYNANSSTDGTYAYIPKEWRDYTVTQRTISGAGIPARTWNYSYSAPNASWNTCTGACPTTIWTDVANPDGTTVRRIFSNRFDISESRLLETDFYAGAPGSSTLLRSVKNVLYANPTPDANTRPWPSSAGGILSTYINQAQVTEYSPLKERQVIQGGDTYTWQAESFDKYTHVTKEKRSNSITGQVASQTHTSYLNDTTSWVLGLPLEVDSLNTDGTIRDVVNHYDYGPNDLISDRYHFGLKVMSYTWNNAGQLASFTDGNGHTTSLSSYKRGIPQLITYPDNTTQSLSVDDLGQITSITDQAGNTTNYQYDGVGRVTSISYPNGGASGDPSSWNPTTFTYSYVTSAERGIAADHWRRTISTGNARKVTYFNALLQPVLSDQYDATDANTESTHATTYNWRGETIFASQAVTGSPDFPSSELLQSASSVESACAASQTPLLCRGTFTTYDALGRAMQVDQTKKLDPNLAQIMTTSSTAYLSGARKQVTDPNGNVTTTSYQVFDQPSYKNVIEVQAPEGITQSIARNIYGQPTSITQSGSYNGSTDTVTKTLVYDSYDRLCRTTEPESGSTVVDYDAAGNIAWSAAGQTITGTGCGRSQVAASDQVTRNYDAMNRVLSINYPSGTDSTGYAYDNRGNVITASSGIATWSYSHDHRNLLSSETLQINDGATSLTKGFEYSYDANGDLASITYPDGKVIDFAPDALGRPTKVGSYASGVAYLPDGSVKRFFFDNGPDGSEGAEYLAHKNAANLLDNLAVSDASGSIVYSQQMTYDNNANLLSTTDLTPSKTRTETLSYDALNRLTSASAPNQWGTESYTYDALNNIRSISSDGLDRVYTYNSNNLLSSIVSSAGTENFGYDVQGNTTTRGSDTLVFDKANRLQQVVGKDSYAYDASGRRVKKLPSGGTPTYYAYSSAGQLLYQYDASTQQHTDYVYLGKMMLAKVDRAANDPTLNPPVVSLVGSNPNAGSYTINWTGESGVTSYELQEAANGGTWTTVYTGTNESDAITGKAIGSYGYRVRECQGDCGEWGYFNGTVAVSAPSTIPTLTVPSSSSSGSYTVSWSADNRATSYTLQQQDNGGSWSTVYSGSNVSMGFTGKSVGNIYGYRVRACNAAGCSGWSGTETIAIGLAAPTNVVETETVTTKLTSDNVTWDAAPGATYYEIKLDSSSTIVYSGTATSYTVASAFTPNIPASHTVYLRACNSTVCSVWVSPTWQ